MKKELRKIVKVNGADVNVCADAEVVNQLFENWDSLMFPNENILVATVSGEYGIMTLRITGEVKIVDIKTDLRLSNEEIKELAESKGIYDETRYDIINNNWFEITSEDGNVEEVLEAEPTNMDELADELAEYYVSVFA
jgi:hypothetical protein